jgi:hypothetical protein
MEHIEDRPSWKCRGCGDPWPCRPAQMHLLAELGPTPLRIHMWMRLELAAADMPTTPAGDLFDRFLHWTSAPI